MAWDRSTLRTVSRAIPSSRATRLIPFRFWKCSNRIRAIVSTPVIPRPLQHQEGTSKTTDRRARLRREKHPSGGQHCTRSHSEDRILCLKFNGWRFQGFEDAKIALIEGIVTGLIEKRPALVKAGAAVQEIFQRIDWLKLAKKAGGLALTAHTGIPSPDMIQSAIAALKGFAADPAKIATKDNLDSAIENLGGLLKPRETKNVPEEIGEFRKAFDRLLADAGIDQLVVLIDDLDRCLPDTAIETLEAVRLFVFTSRTAFVVAADEAMIEYAVRKHFPDLPDTTGPLTYARNYLEKLIQVPIRIPALGETETRIYVTLLLVGAELGEGDPKFELLIGAAREKLRRPWAGGSLDAATVRAALGDQAAQAQNALTLSDQIGPILASGAKGNPRQIKRFLNTLMLRDRMAKARGFGDDVHLPVLAKLMLAERFLPTLFDQIGAGAAGATDGLCPGLSALERAATSKPAAAASRKDAGAAEGSTAETGPAAEWIASKAYLAWAAVQPEIGGQDLRPYLFVAKDRKDYFGAASVLGHLTTVVEQLLGPKIAVQAFDADLRRLAPPEAAQVFELLRARVMASASFDREPQGVAGMTVLVKAHPALQGDLVAFLESLPIERLGAWAVSGWEGVLKDAPIATRFATLRDRWVSEGKGFLKTTAAAAARTGKASR